MLFCGWCRSFLKKGCPGQRTYLMMTFKRKMPQLFYTCRSHVSRSQLPISTLCQRRVWIASQAHCLFVFCERGQLTHWCQSSPCALICEILTVGQLPAQLVHRCECVSVRVFLYLHHTAYQTVCSISKMRTFLRSKDILTCFPNF